MLAEQGLNETVYYRVLAIGMFAGLAANLGTGLAIRRLPMQLLLAVAMAILAGAWAWFPAVHTAPQAYTFAVLQGIAGGMLMVVFFAVWSYAYGPANLGRIQAVAQALTVIASAFGPLLVEWSRGLSGSYHQGFYAAAAIAIAGAGLALFVKMPRPADTANHLSTTSNSLPSPSRS